MRTRVPVFVAAFAAVSLPVAAQSSFRKLAPAAAPSARASFNMLLTEANGRLLLFGGRLPSRQWSDETWTYDGTTWRQEAPTSAPAGRQYGAMAHNFITGKTLLFGGNVSASSGGYRGDTWEWDGSDWTEPSLNVAPPSREKAAMAFDVTTNKIIMFGGVDANVRRANGQDYDDTWEWDGSAWKQLAPATTPGSRFGHAMCFDKQTGQIIMVGGFGWKATGGNQSYVDMWAWTGADWKELKPATLPPFRTHASMHYDDALGRVVMAGGQLAGNMVTDEVWEWDGVDWAKRAPAGAPMVTAGGSAYHPGSRTTVQFGGAAANATGRPDFNSPTGDTYAYSSSAPATTKGFGVGCVGSSSPRMTGTPPWLGETLTMTVSNLPSTGPVTFLLGAANTPASLAFMGFPACTLYPAVLIQTPLANSSGSATFSAAVPTGASLNGLVFYTQVWSVNGNGLLMSNGVESRAGVR